MRTLRYFRRLFVISSCIVAAAMLLSGLSIGSDGGPQLANKEAIVRRLAHQEDLIRSCDLLVTFRCHVTDPDMIPLIEAHCSKTKENPEKFIYNEIEATKNSYVMHWWRKGLKERADTFASVDDMMRSTASPVRRDAFDGTVARTYSPGKDSQAGQGRVYRAKQWLNRNRRNPFAYIYEDAHARLSELLERSLDCTITKVGEQTAVSFTNPDDKNYSMKLVLDRNGLIVRRDFLTPSHGDPVPQLYQRQSYAYQSYRDESGEVIAFPSRVEIELVHGKTDEGKWIVYSRRDVELGSAHFNRPIADEMFTIEFPANTDVRDDLSGRKTPVDSRKPGASRGWQDGWLRLLGVNIGAMVLITISVAVWKWRRRRPATRSALGG
jgi:hypothetical protein